MALTRARVIAGSKPLADQVTRMIAEVLKRPRDPARLALDVDDMRKRIADERRDRALWDVKHLRGGLVDIEFIVQFLQLRDAATKPKLLEVNTLAALKRLMSAGSLAPDAADDLISALALWRDVQGLLKLTAGEPFDEDAATPALKALLAAGADAIDFTTLKEKMRAAAQRAFSHYQQIVAAPAAAARAKTTAPSS
jgi:glutamate-ammonia-ligase adenylyltransferase